MKLSALALATGLTASLAATAAPAFDITAMTETESKAFGEAVRSYLMTNPQVLMEVIAALDAQQAQAQAQGDAALVTANSADIFQDGHSWVGGNPQGDVTLVEFIDYRCGYCRKAHAEVADLVKADGKIRYVLKELPILGDESTIAARFAIATLRVAGAEAYGKLNDALYAEFRGAMTEERLAAFATDLGLDGKAILAGLSDPEIDKVIEANHQLAQRLQVSGTPTFVLGDQMVRGYVPPEAMRAVVKDVRG